METYANARLRLLRELAADGWEIRPNLKVPWAVPPDQAFKIWFKAQAVYMNEHTLAIDIRGMSLATFIQDCVRTYRIRTSAEGSYSR